MQPIGGRVVSVFEDNSFWILIQKMFDPANIGHSLDELINLCKTTKPIRRFIRYRLPFEFANLFPAPPVLPPEGEYDEAADAYRMNFRADMNEVHNFLDNYVKDPLRRAYFKAVILQGKRHIQAEGFLYFVKIIWPLIEKHRPPVFFQSQEQSLPKCLAEYGLPNIGRITYSEQALNNPPEALSLLDTLDSMIENEDAFDVLAANVDYIIHGEYPPPQEESMQDMYFSVLEMCVQKNRLEWIRKLMARFPVDIMSKPFMKKVVRTAIYAAYFEVLGLIPYTQEQKSTITQAILRSLKKYPNMGKPDNGTEIFEFFLNTWRTLDNVEKARKSLVKTYNPPSQYDTPSDWRQLTTSSYISSIVKRGNLEIFEQMLAYWTKKGLATPISRLRILKPYEGRRALYNRIVQFVKDNILACFDHELYEEAAHSGAFSVCIEIVNDLGLLHRIDDFFTILLNNSISKASQLNYVKPFVRNVQPIYAYTCMSPVVARWFVKNFPAMADNDALRQAVNTVVRPDTRAYLRTLMEPEVVEGGEPPMRRIASNVLGDLSSIGVRRPNETPEEAMRAINIELATRGITQEAGNGLEAVIRRFIQMGGRVTGEALYNAALYNRVDLIDLLLAWPAREFTLEELRHAKNATTSDYVMARIDMYERRHERDGGRREAAYKRTRANIK